MKSFLAWLQAFALAIGGPGLFIIAFLDSSFLSLPQLNDLLVVTMVVPHPARFVVLRADGDTRLRRWLPGPLHRGTPWRRGVVAHTVRVRPHAAHQPHLPRSMAFWPCSSRPCCRRRRPSRPSSCSAGSRACPSGNSRPPSRSAVGAGSCSSPLLAAWYGRQVLDWIAQHGRAVGLIVALLVVAAAVGWIWWGRRAVHGRRFDRGALSRYNLKVCL